ncbi:MAG: hypothetical protein ABR973_18590 [Candidatus Acidiferrales bacterium]|jgi:hypothetical protein
MVQEVGFAVLRDLGVTLIAADSPTSFLDDGPTSKLIRQILGTIMCAARFRPLCRTVALGFASGAERCLWCSAAAALLLCTGTCLWRGTGDASAVPSAAVTKESSQTRAHQRIRTSRC